MGLDELLYKKQVAAVLCNQWGDTGKGKFSDYIATHWADVIARGTGGNNAGHTVVVNGEQRVFHILPSGITQDKEGKVNMLGNGMVLDLNVLKSELEALDDAGYSYNNLQISEDAHVIMPWHIASDKARDMSSGNGGIGSTGRGIGPCYTDKIARRGVRVRDLFCDALISKQIEKQRPFYDSLPVSLDAVYESIMPSFWRVNELVRDTSAELHTRKTMGQKILLEGAQGLLLSIEHGTYPYVTSSDCSLNGTASGVGLSARDVDAPLGIVKFPFMTRVGGGPFPTELGGAESGKYCGENTPLGESTHTLEFELQEYGIDYRRDEEGVNYDATQQRIRDLMHSSDEFVKGVGLRLAAREYGATTGRPRRVGWTDAVAARYATQINGPNIILTKVDAIAGMDRFKINYGYKDSKGRDIKGFPRDASRLESIQPVYGEYTGFDHINGASRYSDLPESLMKSVEDFEEFTGGHVVAISTGAEREDTIFV